MAILAVPAADRLRTAAERLRLVVAGLAIEHLDNQPWGVVSISIGATLIGRFNLELSAEQWLAQSDAALYAAKAAGRNRVVLEAGPVLPPGPTEGGDRGSSTDRRGTADTGAKGGNLHRRSTD